MEEREFDKTQLRQATHGGGVHRDYASHFFRWGFVKRFTRMGQHVLDVGCGQDLPVIQILSQGNAQSYRPKSYVGVDLNRIKKKRSRTWVTILDEFNIVKDKHPKIKENKFDVIICYEVIEHMTPAHGMKLLKLFNKLLKKNGTLLLSTPVFSGHAAKNHIHEYTAEELMAHFKKAKLKIEKRWGTFGNVPTLKTRMDKHQLALINKLGEYYDFDVLSCFMAPLFPDACKNNLWVLRVDK